jgi:glucose/arabinose dehydrogenase
MIVADHGPSGEMGLQGNDEVNIVEVGGPSAAIPNLGWPKIHGCQSAPGLITPIIAWETALPPGGALYYRGKAIPELTGTVLITSLGARHLHRLNLAPGTSGSPAVASSTAAVTTHEVYFRGEPPEGLGRLRDILQGPDGFIYLTTSNCDGRGVCPREKDAIVRLSLH